MQKFTLLMLTCSILFVQTIVDANHLDNRIEEQIGRRGHMIQRRCSSCLPNECRVMGMQRYSEPRCEEFGGIGSPCRMWQEPENKTLHFPNSILECDNVYMQYCPCSEGLICDEMICKEPNQRIYLESPPPVASQTGSFEDENEDEIHEAFQLQTSNWPFAYSRIVR